MMNRDEVGLIETVEHLSAPSRVGRKHHPQEVMIRPATDRSLYKIYSTMETSSYNTGSEVN